jgi:hypothetical protein
VEAMEAAAAAGAGAGARGGGTGIGAIGGWMGTGSGAMGGVSAGTWGLGFSMGEGGLPGGGGLGLGFWGWEAVAVAVMVAVAKGGACCTEARRRTIDERTTPTSKNENRP